MSEVRHTPGPWSVRPDYSTDGTVDDLKGYDIIADGGREIVGCEGIIPGPFSEKDARLIAAAPEMLEALKSVEAASDIGSMHEAFMQTRKAIAKAEGRS